MAEKAISQQPEETVFLSNAGMIAFGCGRLELAEGFLVAANAQHAESFNNFALVRERQARFDEAAALEKAIMLKPDFVMAYANLRERLRAVGSLDRAITEYQNAILICLCWPHPTTDSEIRCDKWTAVLKPLRALTAQSVSIPVTRMPISTAP